MIFLAKNFIKWGYDATTIKTTKDNKYIKKGHNLNVNNTTDRH